jgi:hypothetical protein
MSGDPEAVRRLFLLFDDAELPAELRRLTPEQLLGIVYGQRIRNIATPELKLERMRKPKRDPATLPRAQGRKK